MDKQHNFTDLHEGTDYFILSSPKTENRDFGTLATDSILWLVTGIFIVIGKIVLFILKSVFYTFLCKWILFPVLLWIRKRIENWIDSFFSSVFRTLGFFAALTGIIYFTLKHFNIL